MATYKLEWMYGMLESKALLSLREKEDSQKSLFIILRRF